MSNLTIEDGESSFLKGKAEFGKWKREFDERWGRPYAMDLLGFMVNTMPMESRLIDPLTTSAAELAYKKVTGGRYATQRKR